MRMFKGHALNVCVALLLIVSITFAGGGNRAGTSAAPELLIPVGARDIAMGGASVASTSGIDAIFWNPAGLGRSSNDATALFSHMTYLADISINYFAVGVNFKDFGTIGFSLKSLNIGEIAVTTNDFPDGTGELITPTFVTLGITYSRLLADNISVGFTTSLITERIDRVSATGLAINAGVQYSNLGSIPGLNLGVVVKNIGPQMKFDGSGLLAAGEVDGRQSFYKLESGSFELPSTIEIGASYSRKLSEDNSLTLTSLFQNNNFSEDEYKFGAEYSFQNMFFIRGGWNFAQQSSPQIEYIFGPTFGAGVDYSLTDVRIGVDYAFRHTEYFSGNHVITLRLGF